MTANNIISGQSNKQKRSINKHTLFYCVMGLLLFSVFARNILLVPISATMLLALGCAIALIGDKNEIIALAICCIPLSPALQHKYLIFACIVIYVIKFSKDIKITVAIIPLILMMLWELVHGFVYDWSMYEYLRIFAELIFCTCLIMWMPKRINYPMMCRLLAISTICMMLIVFVNIMVNHNGNFEEVFSGNYRFGKGEFEVEGFEVVFNANGLGFICNLSIVGLLQLIIAKKQKAIDYIFIVLLTLFGTMTMSRAFLVCFALAFIMFIFSGYSSIKASLRRLIAILVVIIGLAVVAYSVMPIVIDQFAQRFQVDDITGGRSNLFTFFNRHIVSSPEYSMFGVGIQGFSDTIRNIYDVGWVCHNGTQEIIVCWGVPGLIMFVWFLFLMVRGTKTDFKRKLVNFMPLILILVYAQAGQLIRSGIVLLSLSFAVVSLKWSFEENANELLE